MNGKKKENKKVIEKKRKTKNIVTLIIFRVTSSFLTRKFISFIKKI